MRRCGIQPSTGAQPKHTTINTHTRLSVTGQKATICDAWQGSVVAAIPSCTSQDVYESLIDYFLLHADTSSQALESNHECTRLRSTTSHTPTRIPQHHEGRTTLRGSVIKFTPSMQVLLNSGRLVPFDTQSCAVQAPESRMVESRGSTMLARWERAGRFGR